MSTEALAVIISGLVGIGGLASGVHAVREQGRREHTKWLREKRFEAYSKAYDYVMLVLDGMDEGTYGAGSRISTPLESSLVWSQDAQKAQLAINVATNNGEDLDPEAFGKASAELIAVMKRELDER